MPGSPNVYFPANIAVVIFPFGRVPPAAGHLRAVIEGQVAKKEIQGRRALCYWFETRVLVLIGARLTRTNLQAADRLPPFQAVNSHSPGPDDIAISRSSDEMESRVALG